MNRHLVDNQLVADILDLLRLRVQPLAHYRYPGWQPALLITLLGVFAASAADVLQAPIAGKIVYFVCLNWLEMALMARFFGWWLQQGGRWNGEGALWQLIAACQGVQLLQPLLSWLPEDLEMPLSLALAAFSLVILINALATATQVARSHVIGGVLLFTPVALALYLTMIIVANQLGWIPEPPPEAGKPAATQSYKGANQSTQVGK